MEQVATDEDGTIESAGRCEGPHRRGRGGPGTGRSVLELVLQVWAFGLTTAPAFHGRYGSQGWETPCPYR